MVRLLPDVSRGWRAMHLRFNPTMVRLLHTTQVEAQRFGTKFQSHNGAIAAPPHVCLRNAVTDMFQSHNGAIAALSTRTQSSTTTAVSIPQWCDCCTGELSASGKILPVFQSHNGAIAAARLRFVSCRPMNVSIPQWCDCCL